MGKKCSKCNEKCSISWYSNEVFKEEGTKEIIGLFVNPDSKKFVLSVYSKLISELQNKHDAHPDLKVTKKTIEGILRLSLKETLKLFTIEAEEEKNIIDKRFSIKSKRIDLSFSNVAIEIKTVLDFNSLGAAILESKVVDAKYSEFYIVCLYSDRSIEEIKELIEIDKFPQIKGVLIFSPKWILGKDENTKEFIKNVDDFVANLIETNQITPKLIAR